MEKNFRNAIEVSSAKTFDEQKELFRDALKKGEQRVNVSVIGLRIR